MRTRVRTGRSPRAWVSAAAAYLKGPEKGIWYKLYVILDIYSRYVTDSGDDPPSGAGGTWGNNSRKAP